MILVLYVDDAVVISPDKLQIDNLVKSLQQDFDLTDDGDVKDYLGVRIEKLSGGRFKLTQDRIINRCLEIVGIPVNNDTHTKTHRTPAVPDSILQKDSDGEPCEQDWEYPTAIGALNYLRAMMQPEISYAIHQASRFSNSPKKSHEEAVKRIYKQGMIFKPNAKEGFKCYVDADWAGNWSKKYLNKPSKTHIQEPDIGSLIADVPSYGIPRCNLLLHFL